MSKKMTTAILMVLIFLLCACSSQDSISESTQNVQETVPEDNLKTYEAVVLEPIASGTEIIGDDIVSVDISNKEQGYMIASYKGNTQKALLQVTGSDAVDYRYYIEAGDFAVIPFICSSGNYTITAYENIQETEYSFLWVEELEIQLEDDQLPFLYPNQYVNFNKDSKAVKKAKELDVDDETSLDTIQNIYNYVVNTIEYDYDKAETVQSGYLPVVDETLKTKKGICFDYAALMTCMLRSRGIPSKLVIGYTGDIYHAWISVYTKEQGWVDEVIQFDGKKWRMMDPTFASGSDDEDTLKYISDENNYVAKYVH